jgi:hypothetical protein
MARNFEATATPQAAAPLPGSAGECPTIEKVMA